MSQEEKWVAKFPKKIQKALTRFPGIVSNRGIVSGQPCVSGRRIPAWCLAGRYAAGESMSSIAADYGINRSEVEEAIRFVLFIGNIHNIKFWKFYEAEATHDH